MPDKLYNGMQQDVTDSYILRSLVEETFINNTKLRDENTKLKHKVKRLESEIKDLKQDA